MAGPALVIAGLISLLLTVVALVTLSQVARYTRESRQELERTRRLLQLAYPEAALAMLREEGGSRTLTDAEIELMGRLQRIVDR